MNTEDSIRTKYCGELNISNVGEIISVAGWVHRRRDHGGVIFVDLRDTSGLLQLVFNPEDKDLFSQAEKFRSELTSELESSDEAVLQLSKTMTQIILREDINLGGPRLLSVIRDLLEYWGQNQSYIIHLNPLDRTLVQSSIAFEALKKEYDCHLELIESKDMVQGTCRLETSDGIVEALPEHMLERLSEILREELREQR